MRTLLCPIALSSLVILGAGSAAAQGRSVLPPAPTPDVKPGSITCDECPYPYPSKYLDISVYNQDVRIAYMDVAAQGTPNGRTVLLLHGNNFGGFYFKAIIDGLTKDAVAKAMHAGVHAIAEGGAKEGVTHITAGNYGGNLGPHHFHLKELVK